MKVLVIGGSYFLGRVFTMFAHNDLELTIVNRGRYSMKEFNVLEYHFDRHDCLSWQNMPVEDYDAVVDFCAYQDNDIRIVLDNYKGKIKHYIYISTVDVYQRQTGLIQGEDGQLENRHFPGMMGDYIYYKRRLEDELIECCHQHDIAYTSLRPGHIYGPYNYAPKESAIIQKAMQDNILYHLTDSDATFQMVYVKDVALAIQQVIIHKAYNQVFNLVNDEMINYDTLNSIISTLQPIHVENHNVEEAMLLKYPLPFPVFKQQEEHYSGHEILKYDFSYTPIKEGLEKTYQALTPLYKKSC